MISLRKSLTATAVTATVLFGSSAFAATLIDPVLTVNPGQDVGGQSDLCGNGDEPGNGFDTCVSPGGSPVIAKLDAGGTFDDVNPLWDELFDADDFEFTIDGKEITWRYDGPIQITEVTVKAGNGFDYYALPDDGVFNGVEWQMVVSNLLDSDISHVTFWDSEGPDECDPNDPDCFPGGEVPVPAGLPLMLTAIGVGAYMRKRARKSA